MSVAQVKLWGKSIGAVAWDDKKNTAHFEYEKSFVTSHVEVSPIVMPLSEQIYSFPALSQTTFYGLPGMLADSLPDKFGNALIDAWLVKEGRSPQSFNPVERLCYIGKRGMGALEFYPTRTPFKMASHHIDVAALVELSSEILSNRSSLKRSFFSSKKAHAIQDILRVGTSAGGARAKAVIAWNPKTNEVRSGQVQGDAGFEHWILKFDGVSGNTDKDLGDSRGFGLVEYVYYKIAVEAGIEMMECRILNEGGRDHFMTKRFDRNEAGEKIHMQSLCGLAHFDFNQEGAYSYEQAVGVAKTLGLTMQSIEELFRRAAFNIIARNQDDHVKNIAFLMNKKGEWRLSPAFDITYSYNSDGVWTSKHQMSLNGKRDDFKKDDFCQFAKAIGMKKGRDVAILDQVISSVMKFKKYAKKVGINDAFANSIASTHRIN